jgi:hypothetical protein
VQERKPDFHNPVVAALERVEEEGVDEEDGKPPARAPSAGASPGRRPNLLEEMNSLIGAESDKAPGLSLRYRSIRSISIAEKIVGSIHYQQDLSQMTVGDAKRAANTEKSCDARSRRETDLPGEGDLDVNELQEELKEKAVAVIRRVRDKLTGLDFYQQSNQLGVTHALDVHDQVDKLILQATSNELLCQGFFGWCPFW